MGLGDWSAAALDIGMQLQQQDFQSDEATFARDFSAEQARQTRTWQENMRATQYQTAVKDMIAAGLNPMLAYHQGGAGTPPGATGQTAQAAGTAPLRLSQSMQSAATTRNLIEQNENIAADTAVKRAEEQRIRAQTPTYAVSIEQMRATIDKTFVEMAKIVQETDTSAATARNIEQQTTNLKALLPQIEATINQLKAQTQLTAAQIKQTTTQTKLTTEQIAEVQQRIRANLPAVEAAFLKVQEQLKQLEKPERGMRAATYSTPIGAIGEMLRALNPLRGLIAP